LLTIREAEAKDALEVANLHVRAWQVAYRSLLPEERLDAMAAEDRAARYSFGSTDPDAPQTILAVCEGTIRGFASIASSRDEDALGAGELGALYVDPDHWGQGTGRLLMAQVYERLGARGFQEAVLWLLLGNSRAECFYRADGWRHDGSRRQERMWDVEVDVIRYRRELDRVAACSDL
jgi:GNAT superfamily N-acetyltransferase